MNSNYHADVVHASSAHSVATCRDILQGSLATAGAAGASLLNDVGRFEGFGMSMIRTTVATTLTSFLLIPVAIAQQDLNVSGVRLWLERADAIRGPEGFGEDNYYTSYMMSSGNFRNFTSNTCWLADDGPNCTQGLNGTAPWDATAPPTTAAPPPGTPPSGPPYYPDVLRAYGPVTVWASCGQWLDSVTSYGGTLYGFVHGEAPQARTSGCRTSATRHKTMTLWPSPTGTGASLQSRWSIPTLIIDSLNGDPGQPNYRDGESCEGDCNAVQDSIYAYLLCRNPMTDTTELARARLTNLTTFVKYDNGWQSQPGVNGTDTSLVGTISGTSTTSRSLGQGALVWADNHMVMLLSFTDATFLGLKASFTRLHALQRNTIGFTILRDPLFVQETNAKSGYPYGSNPPHYLYIYPSVVSLVEGTRTWNLTRKNQFLLAYTFVPPYNALSHRILATRSVTVSNTGTPAQDPQVLVELATRYDSTYKQYYSSTQPVAYGNNTTFSYPAGTFSQITADPVSYFPQLPASHPVSQGQTLTKVVECRSSTPWPSGHPDHLITTVSCDASYNDETVADYSYPDKPSTGNSVEIYRCSSTANGTHWVSIGSTCNGQGTSEKSLGWILTKQQSQLIAGCGGTIS